MGLFGTKTAVELTAEPGRLLPGDDLRARVMVGAPDKKARDARVRLVCVNSYLKQSTDSDGDTITLTKRHEAVAADEPLLGASEALEAGAYEVVLTAPTDLSVRALRARVRGVRTDPDKLVTGYEGPVVTLAEPLKLAAGVSEPFPFEVEVPADARPSFEAPRNELHWYLETILDRRLRSDPTGRLELVVRTDG